MRPDPAGFVIDATLDSLARTRSCRGGGERVQRAAHLAAALRLLRQLRAASARGEDASMAAHLADLYDYLHRQLAGDAGETQLAAAMDVLREIRCAWHPTAPGAHGTVARA